MKKIILASSSPKRKELLDRTGLIFEVVPSNYKEDMTLDLIPSELAKFLSKGKAEDVAGKINNAIIISADTFVSFNNKIIGKPHTKKKAQETLRILSDQTHSVFTGFTIVDTEKNKVISKAIETIISFKKLSDKMIDNYIETKNPLEYAGSYTLDDIMDDFVKKIEGDYSSVIGLPLNDIIRTLEEEFNIKVDK